VKKKAIFMIYELEDFMKQVKNRKKIRLSENDYSSNGVYFLTICTKNRLSWFGKIETGKMLGKMLLNESGKIVDSCWRAIPNHYPYTEIGDYVIMPNHFHGILTINNVVVVGDRAVVGNRHACSLRRQNETLPNAIGSFKSAVSKMIHKKGMVDFKWQKSYHDRIIRNYDEFIRIQNYILNNPIQWINDEYNEDCIYEKSA
jgi:REP element-mobilizing transposase RayT